MIKLLKFLIALTVVVGVWACKEEQPDVALRINGGAAFLSLDAKARLGSLNISSPAPWRVTRAADASWLTLSETEGPAGCSELKITLARNPGAARATTLVFSTGDALYPFEVSQSAPGTGFDEVDYCFYMTYASLPALYMGMHVLSHDKPSYLFYGRSKTFDPASFPSYVEVTTSDPANSSVSEADVAAMSSRMMRRIREINAADPTARFGLYVDDLRCRLGYDWFVAQGIDSARVKVSLISDGTVTYQHFYDYFGNPATAEQQWNSYAAEIEALDWNHGGRYPESRSGGFYESWTWVYYLATRPGYRLVLQDSELLEPTAGFIGEKLAEMNLDNVRPYELLQTLTPAAQKQFYRMTQFDYNHFAAIFDASPKPNLVIIGTNTAGSGVVEQQAECVARVVAKYGAQYDIFFKPHPTDTSSAGYEERFGIKLLPGQMPFEIFVWSLNDRIDLLGGYPSTVFLTVPADKVRFLFAPNAASLVRPLNILFRDAQVEWML